MTKLNNLLDNLAKNERVQDNLVRAKEKYSEKPYVVEYLELYETLSKIWWLPSLYSIGGVVLLFACQLSNNYIAIPSGLFVGVLIEIIKHLISKQAFSSYFRKKKGSTLLLMGAVSIYLVSVGLSSWGAYEGFKLIESDKVGTATDIHQSAVDSLNSYYTSSINAKVTQIEKFEEQYTLKGGRDKGRIDWSMRKQHTKLSNELQALKEEHRQDIRQLDSQRGAIELQASKGVAGYLYLCIGVAILIELIIFFIARFLEYYDFKSNHQIELINNSQQYTINLDTLSAITQMMKGSADALQLAPIASNQSKVGFQIGSAGASPGANTPQQKTPTAETKKPTADTLPDGHKHCDNCGQVYEAKVSWQRFCKTQCNHQYNKFNLKK